jgi:hypothetical protein
MNCNVVDTKVRLKRRNRELTKVWLAGQIFTHVFPFYVKFDFSIELETPNFLDVIYLACRGCICNCVSSLKLFRSRHFHFTRLIDVQTFVVNFETGWAETEAGNNFGNKVGKSKTHRSMMMIMTMTMMAFALSL